MKYIIRYTVLLLLTSSSSLFANDWGKADTIAHYSIGPGTLYTELYYPQKPLALFITTIDLTHPYNNVESFQSNNKVPDRSGQAVSQQCLLNTYEQHRVMMGVNQDFYDINGGMAIGTNIRNGEITHNGEWRDGVLMNRSILTIDSKKRANIVKPIFNTNIIFSNGLKLKIDMINDRADNYHNTEPNIKNVVLYNRNNGKSLTASGTYVKIRPLDTWVCNGLPIKCDVLQTSDEPLQTTSDEYVIRLLGVSVSQFKNNVTVGDPVRGIIKIEQNIVSAAWGTVSPNIVQGFHGYPSIIYQGKLHEGEYNNFENGRELEVAPRTMLGMSRDGNMLYVVVNDGRRAEWSKGVNCIDLGEFMVTLGAWNVINFDSGGSSTMVVNTAVVNKPSDNSERKVINSFQAISTAPTHDVSVGIMFKNPSITIRPNSSTQLEYFTYNQYDDIVGKNTLGVEFLQSTTIGNISQTGVLTTGNYPRSGYIMGRIGERTDTLIVKTEGVADNTISNARITPLICYPNPVQNRSNIIYNIEKPSYITISLLNMVGEQVKVLQKGYSNAGEYSIPFSSNNVNSGIYFIQYVTDDNTYTIKVIVK